MVRSIGHPWASLPRTDELPEDQLPPLLVRYFPIASPRPLIPNLAAALTGNEEIIADLRRVPRRLALPDREAPECMDCPTGPNKPPLLASQPVTLRQLPETREAVEG